MHLGYLTVFLGYQTIWAIAKKGVEKKARLAGHKKGSCTAKTRELGLLWAQSTELPMFWTFSRAPDWQKNVHKHVVSVQTEKMKWH